MKCNGEKGGIKIRLVIGREYNSIPEIGKGHNTSSVYK